MAPVSTVRRIARVSGSPGWFLQRLENVIFFLFGGP
jgi:hypothetical protein